MKIVTALLAMALCVAGLCACSAGNGDSNEAAASHGSANAAGGNCKDSSVEGQASQQLVEWLYQKIVVPNQGDLHLNGHLLAEISTSTSVGQLQETVQCFANVTIGFKDTAGVLHSAEPVNIRFDVAPGSPDNPRVAFNEASLLQNGGAYDVTSSLLVAEDQREKEPAR